MENPSKPSWITEQLKTKLAAATWSVFLVFGGLIFFLYFLHIHFMPDLELKSSVALLAAAAIIGAIYVIALSIALTLPGLIWSSLILNSKRFRPLFCVKDKVIKIKFALWLALPFLGLLSVTFALFILEMESDPNSQFLKHEGWIMLITYSLFLIIGLLIAASLLFRRCRPTLQRYERRKVSLSSQKNRIVEAKANLFFRAFYESLIYWFFILISYICFILPWPLFYLLLKHSRNPDITGWHIIGLFIFMILVNVLVTFVPKWMNPSRGRALISVAASFILLVFFEATAAISYSVMNIFGWGNVQMSFVIAKPEGCALLAQIGLTKCPRKDEICRIDNVHIYSLLGNTSYLSAANQNGQPVNFTIPSNTVLSWGVEGSGEPYTSEDTIYSAILEKLFDCDQTNLFILNYTILPYVDADAFGQLEQEARKDGIDIGTLYLEKIANIKTTKMDLFPRTSIKFTPLGLGEFASFFRIGGAGWKGFQEKYPNSTLLIFSSIKPVDDHKVEISYAIQTPNDSFKMFSVSLSKVNEVWVVEQRHILIA